MHRAVYNIYLGNTLICDGVSFRQGAPRVHRTRPRKQRRARPDASAPDQRPATTKLHHPHCTALSLHCSLLILTVQKTESTLQRELLSWLSAMAHNFRFNITQIRGLEYPRIVSVQLAELTFYGLDGVQLTVASVMNPGGFPPPTQTVDKLIDGYNYTKWLDGRDACVD